MSIRNKNADWGCVEILCKTWELSKKKKTGRGEKRFLRTGRALHSLQAVGEGVSQLKTIKDVWVSMRSGQGGNAHAALVPPSSSSDLPSLPLCGGFGRNLRLFLPEESGGKVTGTCWRGWITPGHRRWVAERAGARVCNRNKAAEDECGACSFWSNLHVLMKWCRLSAAFCLERSYGKQYSPKYAA